MDPVNATLAQTTVDSPLRMVWTVQTEAAGGPQLSCRWTSDTGHAGTGHADAESPMALAA
jgi:hypothetical protein